MSIVTLLGTVIWMSIGLREHLAAGGLTSKAGLRLFHKLVSQTDLPIIPLAIGSPLAGLL